MPRFSNLDAAINYLPKVLRWKMIGRGQPPAYLILWQECPPEEATWEAANRFNSEDFRRWIDRDQPPEDVSNERGRSL